MFDWTSNKEQAAILLAEDSCTIHQIAKKLHISEKTIDRRKADPEFKEKIESHVGLFRVRFLEFGLARKEARIAELSELFRLQKEFIAKRGASAQMQHIPGGDTGLVTVSWKVLEFDETVRRGKKTESKVTRRLIEE